MRLIDAYKLLAMVKKYAPFIYHILWPIVALTHTEDAVPVVRCQDCILRKTIRNGAHVCPYSTVDLDLDGFCARGERKDDANGRK